MLFAGSGNRSDYTLCNCLCYRANCGFHNIGFDGNEDAHLTPCGWSQAHGLHDHIQSLPTALGIQVRCLLISPSSRALIEHLPNQMLRN